MNPPVGTKSANCASQEFVTDSVAAIPAGGNVNGPASAVTGHVATFADTTGKLIQDGGAPAAGTVTTAGNGLILSGGGTTLGINAPVSAPNGGSGVVSPTAHTVPVNEGASAQANTGVGSTGQVLAGNTAADPTFQAGPRILLLTINCAGQSNCGDTSVITSTYNEYEFVLENLLPTTNATACTMVVHSGGIFQSTGYSSPILQWTASTVSVATTTTSIPCSNGSTLSNTAGAGISGTLRMYGNPTNGTRHPITGQLSYFSSVGNRQGLDVTGAWENTGTIDGFIIANGSTWIAGTIKVYGML